MGRGDFYLARILVCLLTVQLFFFNCNPLQDFFLLNLVSTIFVCAAARGAFALGLYAVIFSLGEAVQRKRLQSVDVDALA